MTSLCPPLPTTESDHSDPFPEEEDDKEEDAVSEKNMIRKMIKEDFSFLKLCPPAAIKLP